MWILLPILTIFSLLFSLPLSDMVFQGLCMFYSQILPALFPFMVLSAWMIRMEIPQHLFQHSRYFVIFVGFLFGFPLGAKTIAELYQKDKITKKEAQILLGFCNNIGPAYILGFVLPILQMNNILWVVLGFYGIPLLDGILSYKMSKHKLRQEAMMPVTPNNDTVYKSQHVSLWGSLTPAIESAMQSSILLCGYLLCFRIFLCLLQTLFSSYYPYLSPLLEIGTGMEQLGNLFPAYSMACLSFTGFCCLFQTMGILEHTDLSIRSYLSHKLIQSIGVFLYFYFLFPLLPIIGQ